MDLSEVLEAKNAVMKKAGAKARLRAAHDPGRFKTGRLAGGAPRRRLQPERWSVWLIEGLLFYLPRAAVHTLLEKVSAQTAIGSLLGLDVMNMGLFFSPLAWLANCPRLARRNGAVRDIRS